MTTELDAKHALLVTTDGTKTDTKSSGGWLILATTGNLIAHGGNPIFDNTESMYFYRSKICAILALFAFLNEYYKYFQIKMKV